MSISATDQNALIVQIVEDATAKNATIGRTALMKLIYFLQVLKGVPTGYNFSLYTYGPFDSEVLSDLEQVQGRSGVESTIVYHAGGYGYSINVGKNAESIKSQAIAFLAEHAEAIQSTVDEFAHLTPSSLELASTIVFADREGKGKIPKSELIERVRKIKPRFTTEQVEAEWESLQRKGHLTASK